ncbi:MOSC domain-containing protein [Plantactinospora endophytica]|uniref:Molybdenum cofactor biosysynthesis protein n=1 Tax=Plantactinospora endophytica TaxID=673535 RepID=A0ABQ4DUS9_9ACTN|nr:MOSC N-terminal beta barrel domain-containing protein [Plantactinospora endophytica]GIG86217.1 molybdenum cofactor biosysynthesis protein [Plantactinospora endophytica]
MRLVSLHTYPVKGCYRLDLADARVEPWGLAGDRRWMIVDEDSIGVTQRQVTGLVAIRPELRPGGLLLRAAGRPALEVTEPVDGEPVAVRVFSNLAAAPARRAEPAADDWLSRLLDRKVRLVWLGDPTVRPIPDADLVDPADRVSFADGYPLLLANRASLDALNSSLLESGNVEAPLPMTRFRPNVVVGGTGPWAEDAWTGRRLRIGPVTFLVAKPCGRCLVTTTDQETGVRGREPLRTLAKYRRINRQLVFGQNLVPVPGPAGSADTLTIGDPVELLP